VGGEGFLQNRVKVRIFIQLFVLDRMKIMFPIHNIIGLTNTNSECYDKGRFA